MPSDHASEIAAGDRFAFGKYRRSFLDRLDEGRIRPLYYEVKWMAADLVPGKMPFGSWRTQSGRGMNPWHDWLGGYPFEVARPEDVVDFFHREGFHVEKVDPCGDGWPNNEFVFRAPAAGTAEGG